MSNDAISEMVQAGLLPNVVPIALPKGWRNGWWNPAWQQYKVPGKRAIYAHIDGGFSAADTCWLSGIYDSFEAAVLAFGCQDRVLHDLCRSNNPWWPKERGADPRRPVSFTTAQNLREAIAKASM